ncbi:MAG: transketolase [Actinomycetota bacterium]
MKRGEIERVLKDRALELRQHVIRMIGKAGSGHPGGSLSAADIVAVLYFHHLRHKPENPKWPNRDRFVLSKGHACPILYAALAESGYFPVEELMTLRQLGGRLEGHPDMRKLPGVEISSGSLGQGLAAGNGMALAARLDGLDYRVYVLMGDGECQEGEIWEAAMFAAHFRLDNVVGIVDYNNLQIDGFVSDIMEIQPLKDKWRSFGWHVIEIDGHNILQIIDALNEAGSIKRKPTVIIANTVKCKGVSFMENKVEFHGRAPTADELERALKELECVEEIEEV